MRVKKGRIVTNCANTKNFKKANKKVIRFASHFTCAYPDYSIQWICRSEFSGVLIEKAYKEIWQSLHGEWISKIYAVLLQLILFYMSKQGTEAPHVTAQSFFLGNLNIFRFGVYIRKLQMASISLQIILNCGKIHKMKNGEKALLICSKSVHIGVRWHSDLLKMRCIKSTENYNSRYRN